jgi:hypothetical protein
MVTPVGTLSCVYITDIVNRDAGEMVQARQVSVPPPCELGMISMPLPSFQWTCIHYPTTQDTDGPTIEARQAEDARCLPEQAPIDFGDGYTGCVNVIDPNFEKRDTVDALQANQESPYRYCMPNPLGSIGCVGIYDIFPQDEGKALQAKQ